MVKTTPEPPVFLAWKNNTAPSWWNDPGLRKSAFYSFILYLGFFIGGYDGSYLSGLQALPTWNAYFDSPAGNNLGLISASAYMPTFLFTPIIPWVNDKWGRRPIIIYSCFLCIAGAIVGCFANSLGLLIAGRIIVGISSGFLTNGTICLVSELAHPRMRGITLAMYLTTYYIGSIVAAWTTFGTVSWNPDWGWRLPTLLQALGPALLAAGVIFAVPESPRWQIAVGRHDEARKTLERIHANGATDDELVNMEIEEINASLQLERESGNGSWSSLLKTRGNRTRMIVLALIGTGSQLNGVGLASYYLAPILRTVGITSPSQIAGINGGLAIFNYVMAVAAAVNVDRVGRRPLWLISTAGCLVAFALVTGLSAGFDKTGDKAMGSATVACLFIFYGFYDIAWTPLTYAYSVEILPFSIRAKGMMFMTTIQNLSLVFNQWVNPVALQKIGWRYYLVYVGTLVFYLAMAFIYFRETTNMTAEEVGLLFDHDDAAIVQHLAEGKHEISHVEKVGEDSA